MTLLRIVSTDDGMLRLSFHARRVLEISNDARLLITRDERMTGKGYLAQHRTVRDHKCFRQVFRFFLGFLTIFFWTKRRKGKGEAQKNARGSKRKIGRWMEDGERTFWPL
jgi:hypothetical protein